MAKTYMKLDGNLVPISLDTTISKEEQTKTVSEPNFSSGNVVVTPDAGKVLTQVTVVKDDDLVPEKIVKDVNIFGVVGTAETGGGASGGYTVTIINNTGRTLSNIKIIQANDSDFTATITSSSVFKNVTYIKYTNTSFQFETYTGITSSQLNNGKTLENDITIQTYSGGGAD